MTDFIAIDGEAVNDLYALLACSDGSHTLDLNGLSTLDCFSYLLSKAPEPKPKSHRKRPVFVCYGLNYDVNMWLRDVPKTHLRHLWDTNKCVYEPRGKAPFKIEYVQSHWFRLEQLRGPSIQIYEVFGFFQSSFINALASWGFPVQDEMSTMKALRGSFSQEDLQRVIDYCHSECESLASLMTDLELACKDAKIVPRHWMGAGSLAGTLLSTRKSLKEHHAHDDELGDDSCEDAILRAYFGGRVEMLKQGIFYGVKAADIRSAYPYAISQLPSLYERKLTYQKKYNIEAEHAIWRVSWNEQDSDNLVMPFPVRYKKDVYYPSAGIGWYHAIEVRTAIELGYKIEVHGGYVLRENVKIRLFTWVREMYDIREQWKSEGKAAEKVLKLALNSLYGKMAQGVFLSTSMYSFMLREQPRPQWQSYFWAGEVTAVTRARMLRAANECDRPLMIATDGLFCKDTDIEDTPGLGGWEVSEYESIFIARPGVYLAERENPDALDGECEYCHLDPHTPNDRCKNHPCLVRSRGFHSREVDFYRLREFYQEHGMMGSFKYDSHRFIGLGSALMRKDFSVWKTWEDSVRQICFLPSSKDIGPHGEIYPYSGILGESEPYTPKSGILDESQIESMEQPK